MWQVFRYISDTFGVGLLAAQLIKLIGVALTIFGPVEWIAGLFKAIFPMLAKFFTINLGWDINGLDMMGASIALSGTLILASSVTTSKAMSTIYVLRFFMIPYALIIITIAIAVQVATPIVELVQFSETCSNGSSASEFYGSSCNEISLVDMFSTNETVGVDGTTATTNEGIGLILAGIYLTVILPLIAIIIFFFKRLSVNRLLRRVAIAVGAAIGLVMLSTAYAVITGETSFAEVSETWMG